jgi:hypothetical protein
VTGRHPQEQNPAASFAGLELLEKPVQNKLHPSSRHAKHKAAAHTAASFFETLEGRQLMSVAPAVGPVAAIRVAPVPAMQMPLVARATPLVSGTPNASAVRVNVAVSTLSAGDVPVNPGPGGTVMAKKSLADRLKAAARWAKDHIVIGLNKIGIKGTW